MEPHDYGVIEGTERLLTFQLRGPDSGKGTVGWRLLDVIKIESCVVTDRSFAGSRGQSHQQHYQWEALYARVTQADLDIRASITTDRRVSLTDERG